MRVRVRRVYDEPVPQDGVRILVDRMWPRGMRKDDLDAEWLRDVAPSTPLRKWFDHDPARFAEFCRRYRDELSGNPDLDRLRATEGPVTLLTATADVEHSHAAVLAELLD